LEHVFLLGCLHKAITLPTRGMALSLAKNQINIKVCSDVWNFNQDIVLATPGSSK
jgi:hypothetical protein